MQVATAGQCAATAATPTGSPSGSQPGSPTRRRLERAALDLFRRHGFDEVTSAQIAATAGVSERTFFRHFPTKLDALMGDTAARTDAFVEELYAQPPDRSLVEGLVASIAATLPDAEVAADDLVRYEVMSATPSLVAAVRGYEAHLEGLFVEWIAQRTRRAPTDFDVVVSASLLVAARRVVVAEWFRLGGDADIVGLAERALDQVRLRVRR